MPGKKFKDRTHSLKLLAFNPVTFSSVEFIMSLQFYEPKNKPSKKDNLNPAVTHIYKVDEKIKTLRPESQHSRQEHLVLLQGP